ncbi:hypothetical protein Lfu02_42000 [Longispora fulva]|uniref:Uncharacterized protein n=1 Tax=Longispora fulva TaxID=619741 RepID=A0A8J7GDH9_9ACTN|nr:hypothetical protein [Longispora fulva]MBG6136659.1 hypothetical protein [Longispora fulva]GIG59828.1 hypothetical protein Lfu02_42000 [Longispora fulva]
MPREEDWTAPPLNVDEFVTVAGRVADTLTEMSARTVIVTGVSADHWPEPSEQTIAIMGAPVDTGPAPIGVTFECDSAVIAIQVDPRTSPWELAARLAGEIVDHAATEWWGEPYPPCPRHNRHPLRLVPGSDALYWACPHQLDRNLATVLNGPA